MIVFSGHIANWEIGMLAGVQYGISVAQIYRTLNNPLMDRMIARFRGDRGEFIPKGPIAARRANAALHRGMHLGLLADQKMNDGIPVPFFGCLAMTAPHSPFWRCVSTAMCCRFGLNGSVGLASVSRSPRVSPYHAATTRMQTQQR
jgi:lauroyl/myristoyl acyltransferase